MQTGVVQPAHRPVPTVFALLMVTLYEKYSWPVKRSASADAGTAIAATMRAAFGPPRPMLYAPIPPADWPEAQSTQFTAVPGGTKFIASDAWRQVPAFLKPHHAGSGPADAMS